MTKLRRLANQSFKGSNKNKIITHATTSKLDGSALTARITSNKLMSTIKYSGSLIDFDYAKGIQSQEPNLRFKLGEIKTRNNQIDLRELETIIKDTHKGVGEGTKYAFKEQKRYGNETVIWEGYITRQKGKTGVKIKKLQIQEQDTKTCFNIKKIESVTRTAFTNYLTKKASKNVIKEHTEEKEQKEYSGKSAIVDQYDGELAEAITQTKTGITRKSSPRTKHIREGHTKLYKRKGVVRAIEPTVIHIQYFKPKELMDKCFEINGKPTLEALLLHKGTLSDTDIQKLDEENNYKTMNEVYNSSRLDVDYNEARKIFGEERFENIIFEDYLKKPKRKDLSKTNIKIIPTKVLKY